MSHCCVSVPIHRRGTPGWPVCAVVAGLLVAGLALPPAWAGDKDDHDRARAAVLAGEVLPLSQVLQRVQRTHPGRVLEVELERDDGRWIYEIKLLQPGGQLLKLELDASTAHVLQLKRKEAPAASTGARP
jgi:uncharacterized membrane protein YkoI